MPTDAATEFDLGPLSWVQGEIDQALTRGLESLAAFRKSPNDAIALGWAGFFGRPDVVRVLLDADSEPSQRNKHGLTPLGCALGGAQGRWQKFSNATLEDWRKCADFIRARGDVPVVT